MLLYENPVITHKGVMLQIKRLLFDDDCRYKAYEIEYNGDLCELRIYYNYWRSESFKIDMMERTSECPKNASLLWPLDYIDNGNVFGVITNQRPQNTIPLDDILFGKNEFKSFTAMVNSGISICSIFNSIDFTFPSVSDCYDFLVEIESGYATLTNFEYLVSIMRYVSYAWNARSVAPSLVRGNAPSYTTSKYSLALLLFKLLVRTHPLEGVRTLTVPEINDYYIQLCYGKDPIFIADPTDRRNGPSREIEGVRNYFKRWPILSSSMQSMFVRAFSKKAMLEDEHVYPSGKEWQRALLQYRSLFIKCPLCGKETLIEGATPVCKCCKKPYPVYGVFKIGRYHIPIVKNGGIFQEHIDDFYAFDLQFISKRISIVRVNSKKGIVALENMSSTDWTFKTKNGRFGIVKPGEYVCLSSEMEIKIDSSKVVIKM